MVLLPKMGYTFKQLSFVIRKKSLPSIKKIMKQTLHLQWHAI